MKNRIVFILVEPVYRGNIGAAARVINNFGFADLRLVGSVPQKEDHYLAVHSEEIMRDISIYDDLSAALSDIDLAIAITRRSGRKKKTDLPVNRIGDFVSRLNRGRVALVFGRETYGLKDEEVDICPIRCIIPTDPGFPSLNLAQAVAIVAYELYKGSTEEVSGQPLAGQDQITKNIEQIIENLNNIGYFEAGDPEKVQKQLQNILLKGFTTEANLIFLNKMFQRITVLFSRKMKYELTN